MREAEHAHATYDTPHLDAAGIVSRQRRESGDFYLLNGVHAGALAEAAIFHAEHQQQERIRAGSPTSNSRPN